MGKEGHWVHSLQATKEHIFGFGVLWSAYRIGPSLPHGFSLLFHTLLHLGCVPLKDIKHEPLMELLLIFSSRLWGMNWEQAGYWGCLFPGEDKRALAMCLLRAIQLPCRLGLCCFLPTFPEEVFLWPLLSSKQIDANGFGSLMKQTRRNQTSSACYASRRQAENFHRLQKWDISSLTELGEGHLLSRKKNEWAGKKNSWWPFSSLPLCFLGKLRSCPRGREEEA